MKRMWKVLIFAAVILLINVPIASAAPAKAPPKGKTVKLCPDAKSIGPDEATCFAVATADSNGNAVVRPDSGDGAQPAADPPIGPNGWYGPEQFLTGYGLGSGLVSTATTVAIVDAFNDANAFADLNYYSDKVGIQKMFSCKVSTGTPAHPCFQRVTQSGGSGNPPNAPSNQKGWLIETAMDVETVHAVCQNCNILLVSANSNKWTDLFAAVDRARIMGAKIISNSYGGYEHWQTAKTEANYDKHFNYPGIVFTVSSGDWAYGEDDGDWVEYPAASPYVTAVGGTSLHLNYPDNSYLSESVWGTYDYYYGWEGAGSGCSKFEPKPVFQTDATNCSHRMVADVSADADPYTGAAVYESSYMKGWGQIGGTSLAAPLVAATYALAGGIGSTWGNMVPYVNQPIGANLHDVTTGSNWYSCLYANWCNGKAGYDGPSGLGTPLGTTAFTTQTSKRPVNDDFAGATAIGDLSTPYSDSKTMFETAFAGKASDDPSFASACTSAGTGDHTLWYSWTAPSNGVLTVNTVSSAYDTVLGIWTGSAGSLVSTGCNDNGAGTQSSINSLPVTHGTTYSIEVAAKSSASYGVFNLAASFVPAPAAPSGLSATGNGQAEINLAWTDNSSDETSFKVQRSPAGAGTWTLIDTTAADAVAFTDENVLCSTSYDYRVAASNSAGDSDWATATGATDTCITPNAPSGLSTGTPAPTSITLTWTDNSDNEYSFEVDRSPVGLDTWTAFTPLTAPNATTYTDTGLSCNQSYDYRVMAINPAGNSAATTTLTAATAVCTAKKPPVLATPANGAVILTPTAKLTWKTAVKPLTRYLLQVDDENTFSDPIVQSGSATGLTFTTKKLPFGIYFWRVAVLDTFGMSVYSNPFSFEMTLNKTPKKAATVLTGQVKFAWQTMSGKSYTLQYSSDPAFATPDTVTKSTGKLASYTIPKSLALAGGKKTYYWHVSIDGGATWTPYWTFIVK